MFIIFVGDVKKVKCSCYYSPSHLIIDTTLAFKVEHSLYHIFLQNCTQNKQKMQKIVSVTWSVIYLLSDALVYFI